MTTRTQENLARNEMGHLIFPRRVEDTEAYNTKGERPGASEHFRPCL